MSEDDWGRDPLSDDERGRIAARYREPRGAHSARADEEAAVVAWAARMKLGYAVYRAVLAGLIHIDCGMGDIRLTASEQFLDKLTADAKQQVFP